MYIVYDVFRQVRGNHKLTIIDFDRSSNASHLVDDSQSTLQRSTDGYK